jgi:hypothetical protein
MHSVFTRIIITPCLQLQIIKLPALLACGVAIAFPMPVSPTSFLLLEMLRSPGERYNIKVSIIVIQTLKTRSLEKS